MKNRIGKRVVSLLLVCAMIFAPAASQVVSAGSFGVRFSYEDPGHPGNRTGIIDVQIDNMNYYDIDLGSKSNRTSASSQEKYLKAALANKNENGVSPLEQWSKLAYAIYASEGKYATTKMISDFGVGVETNAPYGDVSALLADIDGETDGKKGKDIIGSTGLQYAKSLSAVRDEAYDLVTEDIDRKKCTAEKLKNGVNDGNGLSDLVDTDDNSNVDTSNVVYSLVHSVDKSGDKYYYTVFGLAFYDFKLQAIADDNLSYITAAEGYESAEEAYQAGVSGVSYVTGEDNSDVKSYFQNGAAEAASVGMEFSQSNSMTVSNTLEETSSYTFSQMVGSETSFELSFGDIFKITDTLKLELTTEEAFSTAYSDEKSVTKESSNTATASIELPAQTAVAILSSSGDTATQLDYDCPVAITYKVKVFSMTGDVYVTAASMYMHTDRYLQSYFSTTFGYDTSDGGTDAVSNLYKRVVDGEGRADADRSYGQTYGWWDKAGDGASASTIDHLNWEDISDGKINQDDLDAEEVTIYVEYYEINSDGTPIYKQDENSEPSYSVDEDGDKIYEFADPIYHDEYEEKGIEDYEMAVRAPLTYSNSETGKQYTLYTGEVFDSEGYDLNEDLRSVHNNYYMYFTPDAQNDYTVPIYYVATSANPLSSAEPDETVTEETDSTEAAEPAAAEEPEAEQEPALAAEEPEMAAEEPISAAEPAAEEPATAEEEPILAAEEPATAEEELILAAEEPEMAAEEPISAAEPAAEEPIAVEEEPAVAEESAEISMYMVAAEDDGTEDVYEAEEEVYVSAEETVPAEEATPEVYDVDVIIDNGDLIGSDLNDGTVSGGGDNAGTESTEPSLTIEGIEVVEEEEVPEGLAAAEDTNFSLTIESIEVVEEEEIPEELAAAEDADSAFSGQFYDETQTDGTDNSEDSVGSVPGTKEVIEWLVTHTPMSLTGGTISVQTKYMGSEINGIEALYPLDHIVLEDNQKTFDMISGSTLNVDNLDVEGYNQNNVVYYGFDRNLGYWVVTDANGIEIGDSAVASVQTDSTTGESILTAGDEGTVYLKYMIDESKASYTYANSTKKATNDALSSTAIVKVNVSAEPFKGSVEATGTLTGYVNDEPINLDTCEDIRATVLDDTEKKIPNANVTWEAQLGEEDGIILVNDNLSFTKAGTYKIRAFYGSGSNTYYSNWIEVTALPEKVLSTLTIEDITDPATLSNITLGENVNLGWLLVSATDQYDSEWSQLDDLTWYVDGTKVIGTAYTATKPGTHIIYAMSHGVKSNELTLIVTEAGKSSGSLEEKEIMEARKVASLEIADETSPATLAKVTVGEGNEDVKLSNLTVTCKDQYGDIWSDLSGLTWYVDDTEIKSGIYTAGTAGTHSIYAICDGVKSNTLTLNVEIPAQSAQSVKLNKDSLIIKNGKTKTLKATISPENAKDTLTWTSSDKKVAKVSSDGTVTALSAGKATITVKTKSGKSASCSVTVAPAKGETFSKGVYTYYVKNASTSGKGKVYVTGFVKGKYKRNVEIASTVTLNGITYKVTAIANSAFKNNNKIRTVNTGSNVTTIGKNAFEGCQKLKTVKISNSVKKIKFKAFYNCYALKNLTIGKKVAYMGAHCFCNDYSLKNIVVKTTKLKSSNVIGPHVFINVNKATMKVPKSKYSSYRQIFTSREYGGSFKKSGS